MWNSIIYRCTRILHSFVFVHCCTAYTVISLLSKAIQPNLDLCTLTLHLLPQSTPVQQYGTHPFSPSVQTISIQYPQFNGVKRSCTFSRLVNSHWSKLKQGGLITMNPGKLKSIIIPAFFNCIQCLTCIVSIYMWAQSVYLWVWSLCLQVRFWKIKTKFIILNLFLFTHHI